MIICRSPSCSDSCPNAGTPTARSESISWSGSSDCLDATASNAWSQTGSSSVTNGSSGLTTVLSNTISASVITSGLKIQERVERYVRSISSLISNTGKNASCTVSIVSVESSAIWPVPAAVTQFRWDYVMESGIRALSFALALRFPGDYLPWGPGGTTGCKSVTDLLRHSLAHRFPFISARALRHRPMERRASVSLWPACPVTVSQRRVAIEWKSASALCAALAGTKPFWLLLATDRRA